MKSCAISYILPFEGFWLFVDVSCPSVEKEVEDDDIFFLLLGVSALIFWCLSGDLLLWHWKSWAKKVPWHLTKCAQPVYVGLSVVLPYFHFHYIWVQSHWFVFQKQIYKDVSSHIQKTKISSENMLLKETSSTLFPFVPNLFMLAIY